MATLKQSHPDESLSKRSGTVLNPAEQQGEEPKASPQQRRLEVHFTPASIDEESLTGKNVVVIDVLRSASSILVALTNGAREVIPVGEMESAYKVFSNLTREVTLRCGEQHGKMIQGFDLGNSPLSYTAEKVKGKTIVMLTTNGTAAIVKAKHAKNLLVASFLNLSSVVSLMNRWDTDAVIVCAGQDNRFSIEDTVCAGKIVNMVCNNNSEVMIDDSGRAAMLLDKTAGGNLVKMMKQSDHGQYLTDIGFEEDLKYCATLDAFQAVPVLLGGVIKLHPDILPPAQKTEA